MTLATTQPVRTVTIGVDTHSQVHHAAALDSMGQLLGDRRFSTDLAGYQELLDWAAGFGIISAFGVECTGSYGTGLTRHLLASGVDVIEVNRGHSLTRSRSGKNDAIDAEEAARKVLSGQCSSPAKDTSGAVEAIRPDLARLDEPEQAAKYALRELGRRVQDLTAQINDADRHLNRLLTPSRQL